MEEAFFAKLVALPLGVISYPINPRQRIFYIYALSSFAFATGAYVCSPTFKEDRQTGRNFIRGLLAFVFPKKVWEHPSAWVDVRYFIPHQILRLWIYTDFLMLFVLLANSGSLYFLQIATGVASIYTIPGDHVYFVVSFALVSFTFADFTSFCMHYLQHKLPVLWEFHKVHHSAEVLHPLTNYREHPIDNLSYAIVTGVTTGSILGVFHFLFGAQPLALLIPVLGVNASLFAFNFFGYNLRHSHIWVRWPGVLAYLFGCPAHHQIHHSCKPRHINKNFAFALPVWDLIFGTFYLPEKKEELEIGLGDGTENEYKSFLSIYGQPFINLFERPPKQQNDDSA